MISVHDSWPCKETNVINMNKLEVNFLTKELTQELSRLEKKFDTVLGVIILVKEVGEEKKYTWTGKRFIPLDQIGKLRKRKR